MGRDIRIRVIEWVLTISTHTPSWGVTEQNARDRICSKNFYSPAPVGRDGFGRKEGIWRKDFYSHALVGRDGI